MTFPFDHSINLLLIKTIVKRKVFFIGLCLFFPFLIFAQVDYTWYNTGLQQKTSGDLEGAIESFNLFIQNHPTELPAVYLQRGYAFMALEKYPLAITDFKQHIQLDHLNPAAPFALGKAYLVSKKYPEAYQFLTQAIQLDPNQADYYNRRGMSLFHQNNFTAALEDFYQATRLNPEDAMAYNNTGAARYFNQDIAKPNSKDLQIALDLFSKAIEKKPSLAIAYRNRASIYILLKNSKEAAKDLEAAAKYNPNDAMTYFYKGVVFADKKQSSLALRNFEKALQLNPQLAFAYEEMGNLFKAQSQWINAINKYKQAQQLYPNSLYHGLLDYRIALVYAILEDKISMYAYLKKAKKKKIFGDRQVYQDFLHAKELNPFRLDKSFRSFTKSVNKEKKENKFLRPELAWFRMRK